MNRSVFSTELYESLTILTARKYKLFSKLIRTRINKLNTIVLYVKRKLNTLRKLKNIGFTTMKYKKNTGIFSNIFETYI